MNILFWNYYNKCKIVYKDMKDIAYRYRLRILVEKKKNKVKTIK